MLLDTTLLIDFLRGKNSAVKFMQDYSGGEALFTTEVNVFELFVGVYAGSEHAEKHAERVTALLEKLTILPLERRATIQAAKIAGRLLKQGQRVEDSDILIAGIALSNGVLEIATRKKEHFERIPLMKVKTYR